MTPKTTSEALEREAFEAWYIDFYNEPLPQEWRIVDVWQCWQARAALHPPGDQPATAGAEPNWPTMPPSKGQSHVLFEDGYAEGWSKCIEACKAAFADSDLYAIAYNKGWDDHSSIADSAKPAGERYIGTMRDEQGNPYHWEIPDGTEKPAGEPLPMTCAHSTRSDCALFDGGQKRPSKAWYARKIQETEGLDEALPRGALAEPASAEGAKIDTNRVRRLVEGLAEQQAMPDDWWKTELEAALSPTSPALQESKAVTDALGRMLPILEKSLKEYVFTADKAGEVAADMNTLRAVLALAGGKRGGE